MTTTGRPPKRMEAKTAKAKHYFAAKKTSLGMPTHHFCAEITMRKRFRMGVGEEVNPPSSMIKIIHSKDGNDIIDLTVPFRAFPPSLNGRSIYTPARDARAERHFRSARFHSPGSTGIPCGLVGGVWHRSTCYDNVRTPPCQSNSKIGCLQSKWCR